MDRTPKGYRDSLAVVEAIRAIANEAKARAGQKRAKEIETHALAAMASVWKMMEE
jgi:hypothetical protein